MFESCKGFSRKPIYSYIYIYIYIKKLLLFLSRKNKSSYRSQKGSAKRLKTIGRIIIEEVNIIQ